MRVVSDRRKVAMRQFKKDAQIICKELRSAAKDADILMKVVSKDRIEKG
jgi:hypothetical protein